ncbi:hypothetical protein MUP51_02330, partial [Candidatus Bathyarchaeota archaeon]|nr:hypothetical protein [Candidatus Bathyarchaeota archaeon]
RDGAPVDYYGVGTEMITAKPVASLSGVYKLVEDNLGPRIKLSESKRTYPGRKQVYRVMGGNSYLYDVLELEGEPMEGVPLLTEAVRGGKITREKLTLKDIRTYSMDCVSHLPSEAKALRVKTSYELRIGPGLQRLTETLVARYLNGG